MNQPQRLIQRARHLRLAWPYTADRLDHVERRKALVLRTSKPHHYRRGGQWRVLRPNWGGE